MTKTILIIEDDRSVSRMLKDVLEAEGFDVLAERDGEFGLRTFNEKSVDLIVTDVLIPKIKGFDLIQKIRETEKGAAIPIVVISGVYRSAMHRERTMEKLKVVDYIDKPVDIDRLIDALHDVFSSAYPTPPQKPVTLVGPEPRPDEGAGREPDVRETSWAHEVSRVGESDSPPPPPPPLKKPIVATKLMVTGEERSLAFAGMEVLPKGAPIKGEIQEMPFARLLGGLYAARATGALLLRKGSVKKIVYLRQGVPVFVKSNVLNECLGRVMVQERLITQEECDRSLEKKKTSLKKQGELLVEMGSISPHNLEFALELQMQRKLFDIFSWLEGSYQFNAHEEYDGPQVALSLSPTAMIYEGANRAMSTERIRRELSRLEPRVIVPARDPTLRYQATELDKQAGALIDRIDGKRTLRAVLDESGLDPEDAALLIYALACTSLVCVQASVPIGPIPSQTIVVTDSDIQPLNTGEIDAMSALGEMVKKSDLRTLLFEHTPKPEGQERLDARAFEQPLPEVPPPPPAPSIPVPEVMAVEAKPVEVAPPPPPEPPPPPPPQAMPVQLDEEMRRQIRARLDAEVSRLAAERASQRPVSSPTISAPPRKVPSGPKSSNARERLAPKLDLEKESQRTRKELEDRFDEMRRRTYYDILGISRRASTEELLAAREKALREHHPDRVVPGTVLREIRALAETIYLLVIRAADVLADPDARRAYDREIGQVQDAQRIAPLVLAEDLFRRGKRSAEQGQWEAAREVFQEATELSPQEGTYVAHLALATFCADPKNEQSAVRAAALFDRAVQLSPRVEEIYLLRGTMYQKLGQRAEAMRDFEAAVRTNPDSVEALRALRMLEPPSARKTGLLSRLIES